MIEFKCKDGVTRLEISLGVTTFGLLMSDTDQNLFKGFWSHSFETAILCHKL